VTRVALGGVVPAAEPLGDGALAELYHLGSDPREGANALSVSDPSLRQSAASVLRRLRALVGAWASGLPWPPGCRPPPCLLHGHAAASDALAGGRRRGYAGRSHTVTAWGVHYASFAERESAWAHLAVSRGGVGGAGWPNKSLPECAYAARAWRRAV